jgi:hypothetical protein
VTDTTKDPRFDPMKAREFNALIRQCLYSRRGTNHNAIDPSKVSALDSYTRERALHFIVRSRAPLLVEFLSERSDLSWLASCSYYQRTRGASGYTFLHTSEHEIK